MSGHCHGGQRESSAFKLQWESHPMALPSNTKYCEHSLPESTNVDSTALVANPEPANPSCMGKSVSQSD